MSRLRPYLALTLLCLVLMLPGLSSLPPMDRDESRFMQATRQMLETGDFIRIQFQQEMRAKKPVGAYWLQAASVSLFSDAKSTTTWPYRLPSALAVWAAVLMTFGFGQTLLGTRPALLASVLLATSLILISEAHQAKTDGILLACVVAAQGVLMRIYVSGRVRETAREVGGKGELAPTPGTLEVLLFWIAQGVGVLIKGPVVPLVSLLTFATLAISDRKIGWIRPIRPLLGFLVAVAIAAPWFVAISNATGGAFVGAALKQDLLPKLLGAQESHGGFPGLYLLLSSVLIWPGSLLLWPALAKLWRERQTLSRRFALRALLAWALPTWILFELIPTKLPHYVLPAFPALLLVVAALVCEGGEIFRHRLAKVWYALWVVVGVLLAAAVVVLPMILGRGLSWVSFPAALAILAATLLPVVLAFRGQMVTAGFALAVTAIATYPVVFRGVLPSLDLLFVSRGVAQVVASVGSEDPVALAGYSEPSAVFLLGTQTKFVDGKGAARHLQDAPRALVAVATTGGAVFEKWGWKAVKTPAATPLSLFLEETNALGIQVEELGSVEGLNYSRGKPVKLIVFGRK